MALDVADTDALKRNVIHLLLKHPQGVKLGDFSGAFYKLHGHHPQLALHGYSSLKYLLTDMKDTVVLEKKSQETIIQLSRGVSFDHWLGEEEGLSSSEEGWGTSEEEEAEDEADSCGRALSLDTDFSTCSSVSQKMAGKKSVLAAALVPIFSILQGYPNGLCLQTLVETLKKSGLDLERFSQDMGYDNTIQCLLEMPGLHLIFLNGAVPHSCVVQLLSSSPDLPALPFSAGSSSHKPLSSSVTGTFCQHLMETKPVPTEVLALLSKLLKTHTAGLRVKKLQEILLTSKGFDLEKFSIAHGYRDTLEFLKQQMPELNIKYRENRCKCVVKQGQGKKKKQKKSQESQKKMTKCPGVESVFPLPNVQCQVESTKTMEPPNAAPASLSSTAGASLSCDLDCSASKSIAPSQNDLGKKPVPTEVLALLSKLLKTYTAGLRVKKLQELLLTSKGFDLEKFSVAHGYRDTLEFLEQQMPELDIKYREIRCKCVVKQGQGKKKKQKSQESQKKMTKCSGVESVFPLPNVQCQVESTKTMEPPNAAPASLNSMAGTSLSSDLDCSASKSIAPSQNDLGKKPVPTEVLALLSKLLKTYTAGLRVKKLQELLLTSKGFDLEKFSVAHGYRDTLEFLEQQMPEPDIKYREIRCKCVVKQGQGKKKKQKSQESQKKMTKCPGVESVFPLPNVPCQVESTKTMEPPNAAPGPGVESVFPLPNVPCQVESTKTMEPPNAAPVPTEVLALLSKLLNTYTVGLRVKKLQELLLTSKGFDLEKFSVAHGYRDTLEFLEQQMPELNIKYRENRCKCVVKQGPGVEFVFPLPNAQCQVESTKTMEPPNAAPGPGVESVFPLPNVPCQVESTKTMEPPNAAPGISKTVFREATKGGPDDSARLQNGLHSSIPVPSTIIPNHPSSKEQHGVSSSKDKSSSQPDSDIPAQQSSVFQNGGRSAAGEFSHPARAQVLSKSNVTKPSHSEHLDELKQQVIHILSMHPAGMSLFQFRAAYSTAYQHHLPLGNASSAKQRLLEMSDIVCMKGYGVQTLLLLVSPEKPPTKPGPPVFSRVENTAKVLADSSTKAEVRPEPPVVSRPPLLKTPVEPQPQSAHPLASDHLRELDSKENCVLPKGRCPTTPKMAAPLQELVRPKISSGGHPNSSKAEEAAMDLGHSLPEAAVKIEPVVVPKARMKSSLPKAAAMPVPHLSPSLPSTSTCLRAPSNKESSSPQESLLPGPPKPSVLVRENVRARAMPRENLLNPHSPIVFPAEPQVPRLNESWTSNSLASRPVYQSNPSFSVNIPVPSLFQPVLTNIVAMSQPVVYPPLTHVPDTLANPSSSLASYRSVSRTQLPKTELVSSHLAQNRPVKPITPIQRIEPTDCARTTDGLDPLQGASRTRGQDPAPGFSADGHPVSSPSVTPPVLQPLKSPSVQRPENVHHTWLSSMPCSSVSSPDDSVVAAPSAGVHSKPVVPACQKQYDSVNAPIISPRTPSSSASHEPASSIMIGTESDTLPSKPQPHHISVNSAITSSDAQLSTLLHSSQGSPSSPASHASRVSFRPQTGHDASHQNKPLPGISRESREQDVHRFMLPSDQMGRLKEEPTQPSALQNSPPRQSSDNCVIL